MSEKDIEEVAASFARAALTSKRLGFDCIEFHGAHSYIFDLFFWPKTNFRTDQYGAQNFANRTRFAVEVIRAVRAAVGEDFVLIFRFSQWKQQDYGARVAETPAELEAWLTPLADAGIDIFDCSQRRFWEPEFEGSDLNLAGWAKKVTGKATMTVGSVGLSDEFLGSLADDQAIGVTGLTAVAERLDRGEFDLVGVGRALLTDPDWLVKIRDDRLGELIPFQRAQIDTLY